MNRYNQGSKKAKPVSGKLLLFFVLLLLLVGLVEFWLIWHQLDDAESSGSINPTLETQKTSEKSFDKTMYPLNKASSIWAVVNKGQILSAGYIPGLMTPDVALRYSPTASEMKLRADAGKALEQLFAAAAKDKVYLRLSSGYRSYYTQSGIYTREVRTYGRTQADRQSARPGHSEHQTGLAADLAPKGGNCEIADCFADTAEGKWLEKNAHKHGFILRYPKTKENETGYRYEPWHFRYVGQALAAEINKTGLSLERFFGLPSYTGYPAKSYELK